MNDDSGASASPRADTTMSSLLVDEPTESERSEFVKVLAKVSATGGVFLPPFLTGQPNIFWRSLDLDPLLREVQPATDNKLGALRMRGAAPGKGGDLDLCKLWVAVVSAGGVNNVRPMIYCSSCARYTHVPVYRLIRLINGMTSPLVLLSNSLLSRGLGAVTRPSCSSLNSTSCYFTRLKISWRYAKTLRSLPADSNSFILCEI